MAITRVTIGGFRQETTSNLTRVTTGGFRQETTGYAVEVYFTGTIPTIECWRKDPVGEQYPAINSYYVGSETPFVYTLQSGTLPTGVSINSSTGAVTGTPTVGGTFSGISIRATDDAANTADSNSFSIIVNPATIPDLSGVFMSSKTGTTAVVNVDVVF
jgi:hypothetical protein